MRPSFSSNLAKGSAAFAAIEGLSTVPSLTSVIGTVFILFKSGACATVAAGASAGPAAFATFNPPNANTQVNIATEVPIANTFFIKIFFFISVLPLNNNKQTISLIS